MTREQVVEAALTHKEEMRREMLEVQDTLYPGDDDERQPIDPSHPYTYPSKYSGAAFILPTC